MRHASDRFLPMLAGRTARRVHCLKPSLTDWQPQHHRRIALASQPIRLTRGGGKRNQTTRRPPRTTGGSAARGRCRFSAWGLHDAWAAVLAGVHLMDGDRLTVCPGDEAASPGGAWWVVPGPSWGLDCTCRLRRSTEHRRRHVRHLRKGNSVGVEGELVAESSNCVCSPLYMHTAAVPTSSPSQPWQPSAPSTPPCPSSATA